jgi:hypothetical protein
MARGTCSYGAAIILVALAGWGTAAAQSDTGYGLGALNNGSFDNNNSAFGFDTLFSDSSGYENSAFGANSMFANSTGYENTAAGDSALQNNTSGYRNTALGFQALLRNTTGFYNAAAGAKALLGNTSGFYNTAEGYSALISNSVGHNNTAIGTSALFANISGADNTAAGTVALGSNVSGNYNIGIGPDSLYYNTTGSYNLAAGPFALFNNTGFSSTAVGAWALYSNTAGVQNTGVGTNALRNSTIGSNNIAVGNQAGFNLTTGGSNIEIGNAGAAADTKTIRVGTQGTQTAAYIAGISSASVTGSDVVINSSGRLGVVMSSARFKRDIRDMAGASAGLMNLRPVTFRYDNDPANTLQYGLVAEEVAKVYPELVVSGPDGKVQTVRYSMLSAMLLNELQKQTVEVRMQTRENRRLAAQVNQLCAQMVAMRLSNRREVAGLKANYERDLWSIQGRLAAMEQAMGKTKGRKLTAAFDR